MLVTKCPSSRCGWLAKVSILRVQRDSNGLDANWTVKETSKSHSLTVKETSKSHFLTVKETSKSHFLTVKETSKSHPLTVKETSKSLSLTPKATVSNFPNSANNSNFNTENLYNCVDEVGCIDDIIIRAMNHIDEDVRAEALALLCQDSKVSSPVSAYAAGLIMEFFFHNLNVDSSTFRQSIVKSYCALLNRLLSCINKEFKAKKDISLETLSLDGHSGLFVSFYLLTWFFKFLLMQLSCPGNYQRKILVVRLYNETFKATFLMKTCPLKKHLLRWVLTLSLTEGWFTKGKLFFSVDSGHFCVPCVEVLNRKKEHEGECLHITLLTSVMSKLDSNCQNEPIDDSLVVQAIPLYLDIILEGMNDLQEESLKFLLSLPDIYWKNYFQWHTKQHFTKSSLGQWLMLNRAPFFSIIYFKGAGCDVFESLIAKALILIDNPKASATESGVLLMKIFAEATYKALAELFGKEVSLRKIIIK